MTVSTGLPQAPAAVTAPRRRRPLNPGARRRSPATSSALGKGPLRDAIAQVEALLARRDKAQTDFRKLLDQRRQVHGQDNASEGEALVSGKTFKRALPGHDAKTEAAARTVIALGQEIDRQMQTVDAERHDPAAFAPLAARLEKVDSRLAKLEQEVEALHGERLHLTAAIGWASGAGPDTQTARAQAEATVREQREEAERNEQARRHGEQADRIARQGQADAQQRIVEAEAEAAKRQAALR